MAAPYPDNEWADLCEEFRAAQEKESEAIDRAFSQGRIASSDAMFSTTPRLRQDSAPFLLNRECLHLDLSRGRLCIDNVGDDLAPDTIGIADVHAPNYLEHSFSSVVA